MSAATVPSSVTTSTIKLTPEQLTHYKEQGFVLVRNLIPLDVVAAVRAELVEIMKGNYESWDRGHFQFANPDKVRTPKGNFLPGGVQGPSRHSQIFRDFCDHANLVSAMSQLLGGPVTRFTDQALIKPGWITDPQGARTYYHQDSYYWLLRPESGCNVWIPTDDVGKDSIALAFMPGTHSRWTLDEHEQYYDSPSYHNPRTLEPFKRHRIPQDRVDFSKEVLVPMNPGDGVFFTNFTWHRSEPNFSKRDLFAYAIAYQLANRDNALDPAKRPPEKG